MSPVLRRDNPAMFPVSISYLAASPSASPASLEPSPPASSSSMPFDASTILVSSPSSSPVSTSSPRVDYKLEASTIIVLLSFLLLVLWTIGIYLFAHSLRQKFDEYRAKKKRAKKATKPIQGFGFGYDGLTHAEFLAIRRQEDEDAGRVPRYPPSLSAIYPLPPITIPVTRPGVAEAPAQAVAVEAQHVDVESEAAPVYERGDFHWQGSKEEKDVICS
ncbi:hypothetical protein DFH06DRAFT_313840 [Mycena polygramma]|nr:hypothetical protein DFH06DRAFT_313840 [Mycena polygramma]